MQRRTWLGFAAFCLLTGSRWLLDEAIPPPMPTLLRTAIHDALLCAILCCWVTLRRSHLRRMELPWLTLALCSATVFVLPYAAIAAAGSSVTGFTETLVLTLIPTFVVFFTAQQDGDFGEHDDPRRLFVPALLGVAGAALVIEFRWPVSLAGELWLATLVGSAVLASFAALRLHRLLQGVPVVSVAALAGGIIAVLGSAVSYADLPSVRALDGRTVLIEIGVAVLLDAPLLLLGVWLLRELSPVAFATRYLVFLVVTIIETYVIVRPPLVWTTAAGVLLMAGGAAWLLREGTEADSMNTSSI